MGQLPLLAFPSSVRVSFFLSFPCLVAFIMGHDQLKITAISRIGFEPISLGDFPFSRSWSHPPYFIALRPFFYFFSLAFFTTSAILSIIWSFGTWTTSSLENGDLSFTFKLFRRKHAFKASKIQIKSFFLLSAHPLHFCLGFVPNSTLLPVYPVKCMG